MVRFIYSTEMGATSRDPSQVKDGEVQAAAALQRAQARGRVVELVKGESWPREWGISYVPLQLVAERASGSRDDVTSALRGELKGLIHTVQARGAKTRVTHMVPMAIVPVEPPRPTNEQIDTLGGAAAATSLLPAMTESDEGPRRSGRRTTASTDRSITSPIRLDANDVRVALLNLGLRIYNGSMALNVLTTEWIDSWDVAEFYNRERSFMKDSVLWKFEVLKGATNNGTFPKDEVVQFEIQRQLFAFCQAWRFCIFVLTGIVALKGVQLSVQRIMNKSGFVQGRDALLRAGHASERAYFLMVTSALTADPTNPTNPGKVCTDNYQQGNHSRSATQGNTRVARMAVGTDSMWHPWFNGPPVGKDPFLLDLDADGNIVGHVFDPRVDRALALRILVDVPERMLTRAVGDADVAFEVRDEERAPPKKRPRKGEGRVRLVAERDLVLKAIVINLLRRQFRRL